MANSVSFEVKTLVDKLESVEQWPEWKWQMNTLFRAHGLTNIGYVHGLVLNFRKIPPMFRKRNCPVGQKRYTRISPLRNLRIRN